MKTISVITLAMVVLFVVGPWFCRPALAGIYGGGAGEPNDPYLIYTAEQMNAVGADPNDWNKHFKLMADIDLGSYTGTQFNIIGERYYDSGWVGNPFTGVFDGNGKTISNFTYSFAGIDNMGLFGFVDDPNAEIKNLGLIDPNVNAGTGDFIGSLVGRFLNGTIVGCYAEGGSVSGYNYVGGLVGYNSGTVSNSYATGDINGTGGVGGLVGVNEYTGTVSNSYATGSVSGSNYVGGLVGWNYKGTVSNSYATGSVLGNYPVGGLMGWNDGMVSNSYATGDVSGDDYVGGLVGRNYGTVNNNYATASVSGNWVVGGLVGWNYGTVSNSYSAGDVNGVTNVGGLIGYDYDNLGDYTKSFWDNTVNPDVNGIGNGSDANVIGESTANMQTESTFTDAGWDFITPIWTIDEGLDYPRLWWEKETEPPIEADIDIKPNTLNLKSKGRWITCFIRLPEDYNVADIDSCSIFLEGEIEVKWAWLGKREKVVIARFSRSDVQQMLVELGELGEVELTVSGELTDGIRFEGTDTIRVIDRKNKNNCDDDRRMGRARAF